MILQQIKTKFVPKIYIKNILFETPKLRFFDNIKQLFMIF